MKQLYFVNGALGSGKTTVINQLIDSKKLGNFFLIENEIASLAVDNSCLHLDSKQMKVFAGECICCKDPLELTNILKNIGNSGYNAVVIESSGVTSLNQLLEKILLDEELKKIYEIKASVFLVDALGIKRTNINDLEIADFVLVTKYDLLNDFNRFESLDKFMKEDFSNVNFQIKEGLGDDRWVDRLIANKPISFRDWVIKINKEEHHGQNFVKIISGEKLTDFNCNFDETLLEKKEIYRLKGFFMEGGLLKHIEATREHKKVEVTFQKIENLGIVIIGANNFLLEEFIREVTK